MLISTVLAAAEGASQTHPAGPDGCLGPKMAKSTFIEVLGILLLYIVNLERENGSSII